MRILEVRDGIIKLETEGELSLSSFIKADGSEKSYVAQVIQLKPASNIAFAKILFLYDNGLKDYDKTSPSEESMVTDYTSEMINNTVDYKKPVIVGIAPDGSSNLAVDFSAFKNKTMILSDDVQNKNTLIRNLSKQFNNLEKKVVIIDTLGTLQAEKYIAGKDFKLPLNKASLTFMFEECLNDVTADSKSSIVEIFRDLAEYSQTVPFVPFGALKSIVDDMVDRSHVFKLLVLKNKLSKYDKLGYFAKTNKEVQNLNAVLKSDCSIIDVSKLDTVFQNRYISYIYETLSESDTVVILELSNAISKKTLKNVFDSGISTSFVTHSKFKYVNDIKNMFENFILFPSDDVNRLFNIYATFLRGMEKDECLLVGEATGYIPYVLNFAPVEAKAEIKIADDEILDEIIKDKKEETSGETPVETYDEKEEASNEIIAEINEKSHETITDIAENLETPEDMDMFGEDEDEVSDENLIDEVNETETEQESDDVVDISEEKAEIIEPEEQSFEGNVVDILDTEENIPAEDTEDLQEDVISEIKTEEDDEIIETSIELGEEFDLDITQKEPEVALLDEDAPVSEDGIIEDEPTEEVAEREVIPLDDEFSSDEIIELNPEEASSEDILVDMSDNDESTEEEVDEQIKKEVDKVYTTRKEEDFTENDLDFIDELNNEAEVLETVSDEDALLEELAEQGEIIEEYHSEEIKNEEPDDAGEILETRNSSTPMVPVYDAEIPEEDLVESDPIQQGDSVTHVRFGSGVVEKLVKYGSKTLFMINFDNGGRRLLDPLLTEIKKV